MSLAFLAFLVIGLAAYTWMARRKGRLEAENERLKAIRKAEKRMADVPDSSRDDVVERLRDGDI